MKTVVDSRLLELARVFVKLGLVSFGGPAAHIAMMEDEVVRRRHWLTREAFLDLLGATNLIPGPNSTEMAIHIGRQRAGWQGRRRYGSGRASARHEIPRRGRHQAPLPRPPAVAI